MRRLDRWIDRFIRRVRDNPRTRMAPIGPVADPILYRYFVIPRNRLFNIYLHCIHRSDVGDLHDHRMACISVVLQGHYYEERFARRPVPGKPLPVISKFVVEPRRPLFRWARTPHRIVLERDTKDCVWSLFIGFPHTRNWGFWRDVGGKARWLPHEAYADSEPTAA